MPCGCTLSCGIRVIKPGYPCINERQSPVVHAVLPAAWSSIQSIKVPAYDENSPEFTGIDECLNKKMEKTQHYTAQTIFGHETTASSSRKYDSTTLNRMKPISRAPCPQPRPRSIMSNTSTDDQSSSGYMTPKHHHADRGQASNQ